MPELNPGLSVSSSPTWSVLPAGEGVTECGLHRGKTGAEKVRIGLTWACVLSLFAFSSVTRSRWDVGGFASGTMFVLGISMAFIGCIGRIWCSLFIDGFKTQELVSWGPYSVSRNPLYLFSSIGAVGVALGTCTLLFPVLAVVFFAVYYPWIIRAEEARLSLVHGEAFEEYKSRVPAFFPNFRSVATPETYQVNTRVFVKSMVEATWFVWITLLVHFLYQLQHRTDLLPNLLSLY